MIARRTQARLREKRRRNRTVALSPEDDRRSSFISTFLDTKQLQDQSCQVPSQHSTLSNKTNVSWTCPKFTSGYGIRPLRAGNELDTDPSLILDNYLGYKVQGSASICSTLKYLSIIFIFVFESILGDKRPSDRQFIQALTYTYSKYVEIKGRVSSSKNLSNHKMLQKL